MAINQIIAGVQNQTDSSFFNARGGRQGDAIVSELHGRYYEQTFRGNMYSASSQAAVTTVVGLATTYTGLVVSNPITATVNLVLNKASMMQSALQAVQPEAYAIAIGYNGTTNVTHTAAVTTKSNKVGSGLSSIGLADSSATLPTAPTYHTFVQNTATATANGPGSVIDFEGSVILIPGAYACWVTPGQASVATSVWFSFQWEEVPV